MVVLGVEAPSINISVSPNDTLCGSGAASFGSSISLGGSTPGYQWWVNGSPVSGATTSTYAYTAANGDSVRCVLTSSAPCAIPPVVSSNTVNMVVDTLTIPTITLSGPSTAAMGATVTINAVVTNTGSSYVIHWYNHGIAFTNTTAPTVNYTKVSNTDSITALIVPDGFCYDSTTSLLHLVGHDVGIESAERESRVRVWPNPAGDVLHVEGAVSLQHVVITNLLGQVVYSSVASGQE
jgi:hypothetical protein